MDLEIEELKEAFSEDNFENYLIEELAELEHIKWMEWARYLLMEEPISTNRVQRWARNMTDYKGLSEFEKEKDRVLARRVIKILKEKVLNYNRASNGIIG